MKEYYIIPFKKQHLNPVIKIHLQAFPGFFLSFLGSNFLRTFYGSFIGEKSGISWVAEDVRDGTVLGAVFGTTSPNGFFKKLAVRRWAAFGLAALWAVMKNPTVVKRLFRALSYRGDPPSLPNFALLSSIAVCPEAQGKGVGKSLLNRWIDEAEKRSCPGAYLTTDAINNDAVNHFYRRSGWTIESEFITPEGRKMNRYVFRFFSDGR